MEETEIQFTPEDEAAEFISILKLTTAEEIIATVSFPPEDESVIFLQNPMQVMEATASDKSTLMKGFKLDLWMKSCMSQDETFVLDRANIVTLVDAPKPIADFYQENIEMVFRHSIPNRVRPTQAMGHLGNIIRARALFEKMYKA